MKRGGGGGKAPLLSGRCKNVSDPPSLSNIYVMTSPPPASPLIFQIMIKIRVIYNHKMITWHNNGTNLLNHKISVSYNSQRSQNPVCEDEINFEVLDSLPDTGSAAERLEHLVNRGFFAMDAPQAIGRQILDKLCV